MNFFVKCHPPRQTAKYLAFSWFSLIHEFDLGKVEYWCHSIIFEWSHDPPYNFQWCVNVEKKKKCFHDTFILACLKNQPSWERYLGDFYEFMKLTVPLLDVKTEQTVHSNSKQLYSRTIKQKNTILKGYGSHDFSESRELRSYFGSSALPISKGHGSEVSAVCSSEWISFYSFFLVLSDGVKVTPLSLTHDVLTAFQRNCDNKSRKSWITWNRAAQTGKMRLDGKKSAEAVSSAWTHVVSFDSKVMFSHQLLMWMCL